MMRKSEGERVRVSGELRKWRGEEGKRDMEVTYGE